MGHCLFMRKGETHTAPITGILLSDIAEGSIVKVNENGSPVEFYVAKHDYESALNGVGRTLLVRKDVRGVSVWNETNSNVYSTSTIDFSLTEYTSNLESDVQVAIATTEIYSYSYFDMSMTTLDRAVFILSVAELGFSSEYCVAEGSKLPIVNNLKVAYKDGSAITQWTRTPTSTGSTSAGYIDASGALQFTTTSDYRGFRPCFTLPSTALFDTNTLILKGVA